MKKIIFTSILLLIIKFGFTQVNSLMSTEEFNRIFYNPASIGQSDYINLHLVNRLQWVGMTDAPNTQFIGVSNFFSKYNAGLGLTLMNDQIGAEKTQDIKMKYSYHAWLNKETYISFGLGTGIVIRSFDADRLILEQGGDPEQYTSDYQRTNFDIDAGIELTYKNFKVGFGSTHLANVYDKYTENRIPMHNYIYAKYSTPINADLSLNTGAGFSNTGNIYQLNLYSIISIRDMINAGIAYRLGDAVVLLSQIKISDMIFLGYAYDIGIGKSRTYHSGSHEIILKLRFKKNSSKSYKSPRFFD